MQNGPGAENAFGGVAQAYAESVPLVVHARRLGARPDWATSRNFNAALNYQHITKWAEQLTMPARRLERHAPRLHARRATAAPAPCCSKCPATSGARRSTPFDYKPTQRVPLRPDPTRRRRSRRGADRGRAPHHLRRPGRALRARPGTSSRQLAELLEIPVTTSLEGKSAFPENHPLSLGSGGVANAGVGVPARAGRGRDLRHRRSFAATGLRHPFPTADKTYIHTTVDPTDINKNIPAELRARRRRQADAAGADRGRERAPRRQAARPLRGRRLARSRRRRTQWLQQWMPKLTSNDTADQPVPRDLGPAAHGRRAEHA